LVYFDYSSNAGQTLDHLSHSPQSVAYRAVINALHRLEYGHATEWGRKRRFNRDDSNSLYLCEFMSDDQMWAIGWFYAQESAVLNIEYIGPSPVR